MPKMLKLKVAAKRNDNYVVRMRQP